MVALESFPHEIQFHFHLGKSCADLETRQAHADNCSNNSEHVAQADSVFHTSFESSEYFVLLVLDPAKSSRNTSPNRNKDAAQND